MFDTYHAEKTSKTYEEISAKGSHWISLCDVGILHTPAPAIILCQWMNTIGWNSNRTGFREVVGMVGGVGSEAMLGWVFKSGGSLTVAGPTRWIEIWGHRFDYWRTTHGVPFRVIWFLLSSAKVKYKSHTLSKSGHLAPACRKGSMTVLVNCQ